MGRRRQTFAALTGAERHELRKLADSGASDAELLSALFALSADASRSPKRFAELLHSEFNVPLEAALVWCVEDGLGVGLRTDELADRCWRWIHRPSPTWIMGNCSACSMQD